MPLDVTLNGSPTLVRHLAGSISMSASIGAISTATLVITSDMATPLSGQEVGIYDGALRRFGGIINQRKLYRIGNKQKNAIGYQLLCQGWEVRFSDRIIQARVYKGLNAADVLRDLLTTEMNGEGFTEGTFDDGLDAAALGAIKWIAISVAQAINDLASRCGFTWWITPDKVVYFKAKTTGGPGSLIYNVANANYGETANITETGEDYANVVKIQVGWDQIGATRHSFTGDGSATTFTLPDLGGDPQLVDHIAGIFLNSVLVDSVGILGVDSDKAYYYEIGSNIITQNVLDPVLTGADTLDVDYFVLGRNIIVEEDAAEIAARIAIEGGSGKYEIFVDDSQNSDQVGAQNKALGILDKLAPGRTGATVGSWPRAYEFPTFSFYANSAELIPGNIIKINWPIPDTEGEQEVMIQSVESREVAGFTPIGQSAYLLQTVKVVKNIPTGDHRSFLRALGGDNGTANSGIGGGGSVDKIERYVFNISVAEVGSNKTPKVTAQRRSSVTLTDWCFTAPAAGAPTGADVKIDLKRNGVSILPAATYITLGATAVKSRGTTFVDSPTIIMWDDDLEIDIIQVGSTYPGTDLALTVVGLVA